MNTIRIRYQTIEFDDIDIHIRSLRDKQQFADPEGEAEALGISSAQWALFGVVWESSQVLAHEMENFDIENKRILEVGCGLGLSSLLLSSRGADISATDYHPEAGRFLTQNIALNNGEDIPFARLDWGDPESGLGEFDVIIGADLLYEQQHIDLLSQFILRHSNLKCEVVIVDPGRSNHSRFSKKMVSLGYQHTQQKPKQTPYLPYPFKGQILRYLR